jgi:50S ribosome-binding GTPase
MMGATGSGKTILINAMVNYILGVEWDDPFRFKLIDEKLKASQAHSQTDAVTAYDIHWMPGMRIDCSLTIVDTPGYGDTRGIDRDKKITESIKQFFSDQHGIQEVDVVGIVAAASQARLTSAQVYIFESVLQVFGNDIKENINLFVTFDDGQNPAVMSAVREANVPCLKDANGKPVIHRFNNSGLMPLNHEQDDYKSNSFTKSFWDIGMENFKNFFVKLGDLETQSLTLTKDVLEERKHLQTIVQELPRLIQMNLINVEKLKQTKQFFEENQKQINAYSQPQFAVHELEGQKIDCGQKGQFATNCFKCQITCHYPCSRRNGENLRGCSAMHWLTKNCKVCDNCSWKKHENQPYRWAYDVKTKFVLPGDVLREYEALQRKKLSAQELIQILQKDINSAQSEVMNSVETAVASTRRLQQIALRPSSVYCTDYFDLLITNEERDKKPGYEGRIKNLQQLRDEAEILVDIENEQSINNLNIQ